MDYRGPLARSGRRPRAPALVGRPGAGFIPSGYSFLVLEMDYRGHLARSGRRPRAWAPQPARSRVYTLPLLVLGFVDRLRGDFVSLSLSYNAYNIVYYIILYYMKRSHFDLFKFWEILERERERERRNHLLVCLRNPNPIAGGYKPGCGPAEAPGPAAAGPRRPKRAPTAL